MRTLFLISFVLFFSFAFSQKRGNSVLKELQVYKAPTTLDSICIISIGSTSSRIFLDEVTTKLQQTLHNRNTFVHYIYLGREEEQLKQYLDTFFNNSYKAILIIEPDGDNSIVSKTHRTYNEILFLDNPKSRYGSETINTTFKYQSLLRLCMYENNAKREIFWQASLKVDAKTAKEFKSALFASWIEEAFVKNKYLN